MHGKTAKESLLLSASEVAGRCFHSCLSVCLFTGGPHVTIAHDALNLTIQPSGPRPLDMRHGIPLRPLLVTSGGYRLIPIQVCSLDDPPLVLTSGDRRTYGWQAGGTHPTGMLCCLNKWSVYNCDHLLSTISNYQTLTTILQTPVAVITST